MIEQGVERMIRFSDWETYTHSLFSIFLSTMHESKVVCLETVLVTRDMLFEENKRIINNECDNRLIVPT